MVKKTIQTITEKTSKTGNKYYLVDFADGERASCWDAELFPVLDRNLGNAIEVLVTVKGDYTTIVNAMPSIEVNPSDPDDKTNTFGTQDKVNDDKVTLSHKDRQITAQCLTKCYCSSAPVDMSKEDVLETYHWFLGKL